MLAAIEWSKIGELLWVAPVAGLAVSLTFSLGILGLGRAGEARRSGAVGVATAYTAMAVIALLGFAAVVAFGVETIVRK